MQVSEIATDRPTRRHSYIRPRNVAHLDLLTALKMLGRSIRDESQLNLLRAAGGTDVCMHFAGQFDLLKSPTVSVVGTRDVSQEGASRAARLSRELAEAGVVVMSGLAKGVDTAALVGATRGGGRVAAVIGTPLSKAYPAENGWLHEEIYTDNLLISPFDEGQQVFKANFPKRNRVMALLSDATVIVEASDTSGTLHQAAECLRQDRWLFILKSVVEDRRLTWPEKFLGKERVGIVTSTRDILAKICN